MQGGEVDGLWEKVRYESNCQEKNSKEKIVLSGGPKQPADFFVLGRLEFHLQFMTSNLILLQNPNSHSGKGLFLSSGASSV